MKASLQKGGLQVSYSLIRMRPMLKVHSVISNRNLQLLEGNQEWCQQHIVLGVSWTFMTTSMESSQWMLWQSLWAHMYVSPVVFERLFSWSHLSLLVLTIFLLPSAGFPEAIQEGLDANIPFTSQCSNVSHCLHTIWLWVFLFVPIGCRKKLL